MTTMLRPLRRTADTATVQDLPAALTLLLQAVLHCFCSTHCSATTACCSTPCPRQPKVADFEVARCVQQQVAGLEVTVQDVGCVHVLETPQHLQRMHREGLIRTGHKAPLMHS